MGRRIDMTTGVHLALAATLFWAPVGAAICDAQCLMAAPHTANATARNPAQATGHCDHATRESASPDAAPGEQLSCYCNAADWATDMRYAIEHATAEYDLPPAVQPPPASTGTWATRFRSGAPPGRHSPFRYQHRPLLI